MKDIKFRGKAINRENTWFVGDLRRDIKANEFWIFPQDEHPGIDKHRVHPETIGQYIGLKDKNGKEIYKGDIVEGHHFSFNGNFDHDNEWIAVVEYSDWASFGCKIIGNDEFIDMYDTSHLEEPCLKVIGNIYQNPELLAKNTEQ